MAAEGGQKYEFGRLVLDYLRTFMWPGVFVAFALFYWDDLMEVVKGREVNIFGVEIGPAVAQLQETTQQELKDVQALVEQLRANYRRELEAARAEQPGAALPPALSEETRAAAQAVETKLSSLRTNLGREAQALREVTIQQSLPQQELPADSPAQAAPAAVPQAARAEQAAAFERTGLEAILEHRLDDAIEAFERAREAWPDYHNVAEIAGYLAQVRAEQAPLDRDEWAAVERTILTRYSWGMPTDLRETFRARITAAS